MAANTENMTLLLGASGFLGAELTTELGPSRVLATHFLHPQPGSVFFDVRTTKIAEVVRRLPVRPSAAVIALGVTTIDDCARDPAGTASTNVDGIIHLIDQLNTQGITPVFVSTDGVFNGARAFQEEGDLPQPILEYGRQKLRVEQYLASLPVPWLVIRLPKLLATNGHPRCMLTGWIQSLGRDENILCATDQFFTPAHVADVSRAMVELIQRKAQGIYHLGSPQRLSRRELLEAVETEYRQFAQPRARITECLLQDLPVLEARPKDTSLCSSRFESEAGWRMRDAVSVGREAVRSHFAQLREPGSFSP